MLKCVDCGHVFRDSELAYWSEGRGEYWGASCSEMMSGCPKCHGDYEEAKICESCGQYFTLEELDENHLCEGCREDTDEEE